MIARRSLLGLLAGLPFVGKVNAVPSMVRSGWGEPLPTDPHARLVNLKWRFLHRFKNEWDLREDGHTYAGTGWQSDKPSEYCHDYQHFEVMGFGFSANEAIDDWYAHLPKIKGHMILWRAKPEINSVLNFDTKETEWRVYSRFAVLPFI